MNEIEYISPIVYTPAPPLDPQHLTYLERENDG